MGANALQQSEGVFRFGRHIRNFQSKTTLIGVRHHLLLSFMKLPTFRLSLEEGDHPLIIVA
jgi:hypothetical protein